MNRFYTKQTTKIFSDQKTFVFDFFLAQKINLEDARRIQRVPKSIIGQTDIKLKHKEQSISNYYFQVSFVYVK